MNNPINKIFTAFGVFIQQFINIVTIQQNFPKYFAIKLVYFEMKQMNTHLNFFYFKIVFLMGLKNVLGVYFTGFHQVLLIIIQLICYFNAYYVNVILLGPLPFIIIFLITFMYSRALTALQMANSVHLDTNKYGQNTQYCKSCALYICSRDHHCVFIARCVQKSNYCYFVSYILYSYLLSAHTMINLINNCQLLLEYKNIQLRYYIPLIVALISSVYFIFFTGAMLASSFRSIISGIYTVEQLKKIKVPKYTNSQIRILWFSKQGRRTIFQNFSINWKNMVGSDVSLQKILLVY